MRAREPSTADRPMPLPRERTQQPSSSWPERAGSRAATNSSTTGRRRGFGSCGDLARLCVRAREDDGDSFTTDSERKGSRVAAARNPYTTGHHLQEATRACASVELRTQNRVMLLNGELLC